MRFASRVLLVVAILPGASTLADEPNRSPLTSHLRSLLSMVQSTEQDDGNATSHPLILRIHEKAFVNQAGDTVNTTRPVSCVILSTPATGAAWTTGRIQVDTNAAENAADFLVTFRGRSFSRTVGINGPAHIHSHSVTDFVVSRHVVFSPREGFRSRPTTINSQTHVTLDDVRSTKPGLRGRIVRRVALRRASESHQAAEREAAAYVRRQLAKEFDDHLDAKVADVNRQLQAARYAGILFGNSDELSVRVCSADDCVQIAVGRAHASQQAAVFPLTPASAPIEIWLHQTPFNEESARAHSLLALLSAGARTVPAAQAIGLAAWRPALPSGFGMRMEKDWTVISIDSPPASEMTGEMRLARRSAN